MLDTAREASERKELLEGIIARTKGDNARLAIKTMARLDAARAEAHRLARELAALDGVQRVIHFGSSASGRNFRLDSDIDMAISGGDILEAMRVAESSVFHVDVIDIDAVPSPLKEAILQQGAVLYEKRR
jgi:predicted nucleotidyltransferase